jgi:hypothetical protein
MKALLVLSMMLPLFAQAAPHTLADRLAGLIPEGYSEGVTATGAPCRVIFSWMRGPGFEPEYARAQVIAEPEGNLVDVEIFFDGYKGKAYGRWSASYASLQYRNMSLSATKAGNSLIVRAEKKLGSRKISSSCQIQRKPRAFRIERTRRYSR